MASVTSLKEIHSQFTFAYLNGIFSPNGKFLAAECNSSDGKIAKVWKIEGIDADSADQFLELAQKEEYPCVATLNPAELKEALNKKDTSMPNGAIDRVDYQIEQWYLFPLKFSEDSRILICATDLFSGLPDITLGRKIVLSFWQIGEVENKARLLQTIILRDSLFLTDLSLDKCDKRLFPESYPVRVYQEFNDEIENYRYGTPEDFPVLKEDSEYNFYSAYSKLFSFVTNNISCLNNVIAINSELVGDDLVCIQIRNILSNKIKERIYNFESNQVKDILTLKFSPKGNFLFVACKVEFRNNNTTGKSFGLFNINTNKLMAKLNLGNFYVSSTAFSRYRIVFDPEETKIIFYYKDEYFSSPKLQIWDIKTGRKLREISIVIEKPKRLFEYLHIEKGITDDRIQNEHRYEPNELSNELNDLCEELVEAVDEDGEPLFNENGEPIMVPPSPIESTCSETIFKDKWSRWGNKWFWAEKKYDRYGLSLFLRDNVVAFDSGNHRFACHALTFCSNDLRRTDKILVFNISEGGNVTLFKILQSPTEKNVPHPGNHLKESEVTSLGFKNENVLLSVNNKGEVREWDLLVNNSTNEFKRWKNTFFTEKPVVTDKIDKTDKNETGQKDEYDLPIYDSQWSYKYHHEITIDR